MRTGSRLAVVGHSHPLSVCDVRAGALFDGLPEGLQSHSLCFSPDGNRLCLFDTPNGSAQVVDLRDGSVRALKCRVGPASDSFDYSTFTPDGRLMLAQGSVLTFWDLEGSDDTPVFLMLGRGSAERFAWSPDGRRLATVHYDSVRLWPWPGVIEAALRAPYGRDWWERELMGDGSSSE